MRRMWAVIAAVLVCLAFGGLPAVAQESSEQPSAEDTTIGFTNMFRDGGFFSDIEAGAREAAAAAGVDLLVETASGSAVAQASHVAGFIEDGVDAILITPVDPDAIVPAVEAANAAGIPVLAVDRTASGGTITSLIASDNVAAGRMAGEALFGLMGGSGKVIEIQGDMAVSSGSLRSEGFGKALEAAPGISLAVQVPANFDYGTAYQATRQALEEDPEIRGVFASNLDMLYGAAAGVAAAGNENRVRVAGVDTGPDILEMIADGRIGATVAQQPRLMGQKAVEAALAVVAGEPIEAFIPVETILVTADNVDEFLSGGVVAAEETEVETASPVPPAMTPAVFSGEAICGSGASPWSGKWSASDPRVTGPCSGDSNARLVDRYPGPLVGEGHCSVNGPHGDWVGTWGLMYGDDFRTVSREFVVLEGTEAYEGWAVWAWATTPEGWQEGEPMDLEGVIYEGSAPWLEWPEE